MTRSRFSYIIYLNYFFVLFFIGFAARLFSLGFKNRKQEIGTVIILLLVLFLFYVTAKWANRISIDGPTILIKGLFKRRVINYEEIASINLFSIEDFYWATGLTTVATRLTLGNGGKVVIADPFYKNIGEIKSALNENFKEKIEPFQSFLTKTASTNTVLESSYEKFSGNPYTSFNGLMIFGWTAFILSLPIFIKRPLVPAHLFVLFPTIIFYLGFGYQLNYFLISNQHLIVKNHFLFWVNKKYSISDIIAANFESPYRRSRGLRIIKKDFKSKLYCAGSLRDNHWDALREKLKELQIHFV